MPGGGPAKAVEVIARAVVRRRAAASVLVAVIIDDESLIVDGQLVWAFLMVRWRRVGRHRQVIGEILSEIAKECVLNGEAKWMAMLSDGERLDQEQYPALMLGP